ncbi:MAG: MogA/MoaB family molybdenum cofactor biosynthesis protein [Planctomycetota bacterium]
MSAEACRPKLRAVLVLASDRVSRGERADATAAGLRAILNGANVELVSVLAVPDDQERLATALREACVGADLVLSSGGTGIGPRDVTPEATRQVVEREIPGLGEAMRAVSRDKTPTAPLSRALAGSRGGSLIVNLPGSPAGAAECLTAVLPALLHGCRLLQGAVRDCAQELAPRP